MDSDCNDDEWASDMPDLISCACDGDISSDEENEDDKNQSIIPNPNNEEINHNIYAWEKCC